jgi:ribosome-associated toxin RatA of RatAB toxin-antitoxin module
MPPLLPPLLLSAAFLLALVGKALAGGNFDVLTQRAGDLVQVRAHASIDAPLSVVWATLTDYEGLPDFIPSVKRSRIVARNGATTTIEQSGEARFLFLRVPIEVTLEVTERPPAIEVRRIAGTLRHLQGRYETEVVAQMPAVVQLRWIGTVAPEDDLPPLIGETLIRMQIQEQFAGMVREIERREAARRLALGAGMPGSVRPPAPAATAQSLPGSQR